MLKAIDIKKISEELLEVLVKNEVPIASIDQLFAATKDVACHRSITQNNKQLYIYINIQ
jgi:hypothetical protein